MAAHNMNTEIPKFDVSKLTMENYVDIAESIILAHKKELYKELNGKTYDNTISPSQIRNLFDLLNGLREQHIKIHIQRVGKIDGILNMIVNGATVGSVAIEPNATPFEEAIPSRISECIQRRNTCLLIKVHIHVILKIAQCFVEFLKNVSQF